MTTARSADGTPIAYDVRGSGPRLVLVDGAFCHRAFGPTPKLAPVLAARFTVVAYDRRGRNESGDTKPYAVAREVEDLAAVLAATGGPAFVFGQSSGAVLAVRAAAAGVPITKLALYEPPLVVEGAPPPAPVDRWGDVDALVAADQRGDAVKAFMRMVGVPGFVLPIMRVMPGVWSKLTAAAHTLPYDHAVLGDIGTTKPLPADLVAALAAVAVPTLVAVGGKGAPWMRHAVDLVAGAIRGATKRELPGQRHDADPKVIAAALADFLL
ncbi:MAG TPA: alpha/beta fold hydrolase [Kofleriaceae bacterium]|jgi:pimeloyl-ACP methyl ester carboxylesterase